MDDKVHCLVTVVSAEKIHFLGKKIIEKMKRIINTADDMGEYANISFYYCSYGSSQQCTVIIDLICCHLVVMVQEVDEQMPCSSE